MAKPNASPIPPRLAQQELMAQACTTRRRHAPLRQTHNLDANAQPTALCPKQPRHRWRNPHLTERRLGTTVGCHGPIGRTSDAGEIGRPPPHNHPLLPSESGPNMRWEDAAARERTTQKQGSRKEALLDARPPARRRWLRSHPQGCSAAYNPCRNARSQVVGHMAPGDKATQLP